VPDRSALGRGPSGESEWERQLDARLFYTSPLGSEELREALAALEQVDVGGANPNGCGRIPSPAFLSRGRTGANIVLPSPGFPTNDGLGKVSN
jgi:hypothetical protein